MYWSILRTRSRASKTCSVCLSMKASYISVFRKCGIALIACASQRLLSTCSKITMKALPGHDLRPMLNSRKFSQPTAWTKASSHEKLVQNCSISKKTAQELDRTDFSIHFHASTMDGMIEMFAKMKSIFNLSFETRLILKNNDEVVFVFQKTVPHVNTIQTI